MQRAHRLVELSRAADGVHQAAQQPLAGVGHLYAVGPVERGGAAAQRPAAGAVPDRARSGRRVHARRDRPAPPRGVQRHLAGRPRLPGERALLPRRRRARGDQSTAATCAASAAAPGRRAAAASGRHDRPAQRLHAAARASASTCASSSGFRCRPRVDRRHRGGVQRVQLAELDDQHRGEQPAVRQRIAGQNRTAQFGFRLTF